MKEYIINNEDELALLSQQMQNTNNHESIKLVFSNNCVPFFALQNKEAFLQHLALLNQTCGITSLSTHEYILTKDNVFLLSSFPDLIDLHVTIHPFDDAYSEGMNNIINKITSLFCLMQDHSNLNNIVIDVKTLQSNEGYSSHKIHSLLYYINLCLKKNENITSFVINEEFFKNNVFLPKYADKWNQIQAILQERQTPEYMANKLASLYEKYEKIKEKYLKSQTLLQTEPNNLMLQLENKDIEVAFQNSKKSFFTMAEYVIQKEKGEGKIGVEYFLALVYQIENPKKAYALLMKVSKDSKYYTKANLAIADLFSVDDSNYCEIFYPDFYKLEKTEQEAIINGEKGQEILTEKRKKIIEHCMLAATANNQSSLDIQHAKQMLSTASNTYIHDGELSGNLQNPFHDVPFEKPVLTYLNLLELLRKSEEQLKTTQEALELAQKKLKSAQEEPKEEVKSESQNAVLFSLGSQNISQNNNNAAIIPNATKEEKKENSNSYK